MLIFFYSARDNCGQGYCPECEPSALVACQFCSERYCDSGHCDGLNMCQGGGCNRSNCTRGECFDNNEVRQACVRDLEDEEGFIHTYCSDCWGKYREGIKEGDSDSDA